MQSISRTAAATRRFRAGSTRLVQQSSALLNGLGAIRLQHMLRQLPYDLENGLGDFLSPEALETIAVEYQGGLLERLNQEVAGTELENLSVVQTVIQASSSKRHALAFNYASQALNNSFFLDNLVPPPIPGKTEGKDRRKIDGNFLSIVRESFGSFEQLKSSMSAAALGMMGSGWVWLVSDETGKHLAFMPTYGPGTMLVRSRQQRHPHGFNVKDETYLEYKVLGELEPQTRKSSKQVGWQPPRRGGGSPPPPSHKPGSQYDVVPPLTPSGQIRRFSNSSLLLGLHTQRSTSSRFAQRSLPWQTVEPLSKANSMSSSVLSPSENPTTPVETERIWNKLMQGSGSLHRDVKSPIEWSSNRWKGENDDVCPLMCISVHEHAWMAGGYGVWGKEEYLRRFWSVVDWNRISQMHVVWSHAHSQETRPASLDWVEVPQS